MFTIKMFPRKPDKKLKAIVSYQLGKGQKDLEKIMQNAIGIARTTYLSGGSNAVLHKRTGRLSESLRVEQDGNELIYGAGVEAQYAKYHEQITNKFPRMYKQNIIPKRPFLIPSFIAALKGLKPDLRWRKIQKEKLLKVLHDKK